MIYTVIQTASTVNALFAHTLTHSLTIIAMTLQSIQFHTYFLDHSSPASKEKSKIEIISTTHDEQTTDTDGSKA